MFENRKNKMKIQSIAVEEVFPNPFQPRRDFDEKELSALAESIRENGLIQPIAVRKIKNGFEIIAGERRLRAFKVLERKKIDAVIYDIDDRDSAVWALIENLQRSDLGPFDEAEAIAKLVASWNIPREEAAKKLGFAPSTLSNKLRILKIEPSVRKIISENLLSERHARELLRLETEGERKAAAEYIAAKGMSVFETEKYITRLLENKKPKKQSPRYIVRDLRLFINTFEHAVEVMNCAGLCAVSAVNETEEYITYSVSVPKNRAFRRAENSAEKCAAPVCSVSTPSVI